MYKKICACRICGNTNLKTIMDLGVQKLTGIFPLPGEEIGEGPLELVKCIADQDNGSVCGLVQLRYSCDSSEMYGDNYGYRSGLNSSMVEHLEEITDGIKAKVALNEGDLVVDIGSNDSTLLQSYRIDGLDYVGMDPSGKKFKKYYPNYIELIPDFFSADNLIKNRPGKKAKVVTSIAMFYDLENPITFAKDIYSILADDGIWILEQSYLPAMLEAKAYDTICQEHLEFYCLAQIEWIMEAANLRVIEVSQNDTNGGSFRIIAAKKESNWEEDMSVHRMRLYEKDGKFDLLKTYEDFEAVTDACKEELVNFINKAKEEGKRVYGYGASTKGNVILQYCGLTRDDIIAIAEVNEDKFGHVTPGSNIPIVSEKEAKEGKPDYFIVLPWHFKENILKREKEYIEQSGCAFVFPLPEFNIVGGER